MVDDKKRTRLSIALVFHELGYSVTSAADGDSALREIHRQNPDILFCDLKMPGMSGFELLMNVRRLYPAIRVIATSGSSSGGEVPAGILADAFYPKGSSMSALLRILRTLRFKDQRLPDTSHDQLAP